MLLKKLNHLHKAFIKDGLTGVGIDLTIEWFKNNWKHIQSSAEFPPGKNSALDV